MPARLTAVRPPQMFKHLLFRGLQDVRYVFSAASAVSTDEIKALLKEANGKVRGVWEDENVCFWERWARCTQAVDQVVKYNAPDEAMGFKGVPEELPDSLCRAFDEIYCDENLLSIGRVDRHAYRAQEAYASQVEEMLGGCRRFRSRAATCLGKAYGRSSMPLLCMASVAGLWRLCCNPFYKRILSLVGLPRSPSLTSC